MKTNKSSQHNMEMIFKATSFLLKATKEVLLGVQKNRIPWLHFALWASFINILFMYSPDQRFFEWMNLSRVYNLTPNFFFWSSYIFLMSLGILAWGMKQVKVKERLSKHLTNIFQIAGIKNNLGHVPDYIGDYSVDEHTRVLVLASNGITKEKFLAKKKDLEISMKVHIDDFREYIERGVIELQYAFVPMPELINFKIEDVKKNFHYLVGATPLKVCF